MSSILKCSGEMNLFKDFKFKMNLGSPFGFGTVNMFEKYCPLTGRHFLITPSFNSLLISLDNIKFSVSEKFVFFGILFW